MTNTSHMDAGEMVNYLTDCTLATVAHMAMKKNPPKGEFQRQIEIAQCGVDHIRSRAHRATGRVLDVIRYHGSSVSEWAEEQKL